MSILLSKHTPTPKIYTLSLHDALPILPKFRAPPDARRADPAVSSTLFASSESSRQPGRRAPGQREQPTRRSEEHTSELQSRGHLVCRLLLEKKNKRSRQLNTLIHIYSS